MHLHRRHHRRRRYRPLAAVDLRAAAADHCDLCLGRIAVDWVDAVRGLRHGHCESCGALCRVEVATVSR